MSSKGCATNLVRFIIQECSEAIIAAYLYKGLDTDVRGEGEGSELSQFSCSAGDDAVGGKEGWGRRLWGALSPHRGPMQTASLWWINIRWGRIIT